VVPRILIYRLALAFTRRHAVNSSLRARTSRPWDGRSSRKYSWLTFVALVVPVGLKSGRERPRNGLVWSDSGKPVPIGAFVIRRLLLNVNLRNLFFSKLYWYYSQKTIDNRWLKKFFEPICIPLTAKLVLIFTININQQ
jgi:hypothetical protein